MDTNMKVSLGVAGLLASAHSTSSFKGERYFFRGDLRQMSVAQRVASLLGIQTGIEGGLPFAMSKEDFDCVKEYLISNRMEGWWNYVSTEEYRKLKGEYHFGGKYLRYQKQIQQIADELGIQIQEGEVLFATSEDDFNAIVQKLDITE